MPARRRVNFPCCICDKACGVDTIQCTECNVWLHRKCTGLSQVQFSAFNGDNVPYECPRCIGRRDDGTYDCSVPLGRLRSDPRPATARRVQELLSTYKAAPTQTISTGVTMPGEEDVTALAVMKLYQAALVQRMSPRATISDGNCCYR